MITLNELRIWHWGRVESHRKSQIKYELRLEMGNRAKFYNERKVADHKREAEFHIKCIQALNDILETTAFYDMEPLKGN